MPTYEYYCEKCKDTVEVIHKMSERTEVLCSKCGEERKKIISGPACVGSKVDSLPEIIFKGEGYPSKTVRIAGQMRARQRRTRKKGFELPDRQIIPNYEGEAADTWEGAKEIAKKKGAPISEGSKERRSLTENELKTFDKKITEVAKRKEKKQNLWNDVKSS